jgi:heme/copper-type cytochrome/quinol oxidase subunit 2
VLHSWAVPSLGIKLDACPGRLNEVFVHILRQGYFYGQCSEICGVNHAFMPIMVNAVSYIKYTDWLAVRYFENIDSILDLWWRRWFFRHIVRS